MPDENLHGYRWRDGVVRTDPEPMTATEAQERTEIAMQRLSVEKPTELKEWRVSYATWVRAFTRWQTEMDAWEAKHGSRKG